MSTPQYPQGPDGQNQNPQGDPYAQNQQGHNPDFGQQPHEGQQGQYGQQAGPGDGGYAQNTQGQQGGYDQPGFNPQGGYRQPAPEAPPAKKGMPPILRNLLGLVAIIALIAIVGALANKVPKTMDIGNCITVVKKGSDHDAKKADCNDANTFSLVVVQKMSGSAKCADPYASYTYTRKSTKTVYCLMDNMVKDKCYGPSGSDIVHDVVVACSDPKAKYKVVERKDGVADESVCEADADFLTFAKDPKRTYCFGSPE